MSCLGVIKMRKLHADCKIDISLFFTLSVTTCNTKLLNYSVMNIALSPTSIYHYYTLLEKCVLAFDTLPTIVGRRTFRWFGHVERAKESLAYNILQGQFNGKRSRWSYNVKDWAGLS